MTDREADEPRYDVLSLRPTQFCAGFACAENKSHESLMTWNKGIEHYREFLRRNKVVVVRGPSEDGKEALYIVDHHHLVLAIHLAKGIPECEKRVYVEELEAPHGLVHLSWSEFWTTMMEKNHAYLRIHGVPHPPSQLPKDVRGLIDDPYRTLAWAVRKLIPQEEHGYRKNDVPFNEFLWGEYLRNSPVFQEQLRVLGVPPQLGADTEIRPDVIRAAAKACRLPEARHLPGYIGPVPDTPSIAPQRSASRNLARRLGLFTAAALTLLTVIRIAASKQPRATPA